MCKYVVDESNFIKIRICTSVEKNTSFNDIMIFIIESIMLLIMTFIVGLINDHIIAD